jgi:hypothetical protein
MLGAIAGDVIGSVHEGPVPSGRLSPFRSGLHLYPRYRAHGRCGGCSANRPPLRGLPAHVLSCLSECGVWRSLLSLGRNTLEAAQLRRGAGDVEDAVGELETVVCRGQGTEVRRDRIVALGTALIRAREQQRTTADVGGCQGLAWDEAIVGSRQRWVLLASRPCRDRRRTSWVLRAKAPTCRQSSSPAQVYEICGSPSRSRVGLRLCHHSAGAGLSLTRMRKTSERAKWPATVK